MSKKNKKAEAPVAEPKAPKKSKRSKNEAVQTQKVKSRKSKGGANPIRNLTIFAVAAVALGVAFILYPDVIEAYGSYLIGGILALIGVVSIIFYFARKMIDGVYRSEFAVGLLAIAAGAYVAVLADTSLTFILLVIGILVAADGVLKLQYTLDLCRMKFRTWWLPLLMGVLGTAIGVVVIMGLASTLADTLGMEDLFVLGIAFCLNAAFDICTLITVAVRNRKAARAAAQASMAIEFAPPKPVEKPMEVVVEIPSAEPVPVEEPVLAEEPAPEFIPPMEASAPVFEAPVEEPAPVVETPVEEPAPVVVAPMEEPAPVAEVVAPEPAPEVAE